MRLPYKRLHGDVVVNTSVAGLTLSETSYAPNLKLPKHSHEQAYFCFVLAGGFIEDYGKRSRSCRPSTLIFHPSGETHSDSFYSDTRCFNIQMNTEWTRRFAAHLPVLDSAAHFYGGFLAHTAQRFYDEFRQPDDFSSLVIEGLALEMLAGLLRRSVKDGEHATPRRLQKVRDLLQQRFNDPLTLSEIADAVGVHPAHLCREFRRHYRCTVGDYVRKLRIDYASQRLSSSDASLTEIAAEAGFFDQSHFARTFKALVGTTPRRYRIAMRSR